MRYRTEYRALQANSFDTTPSTSGQLRRALHDSLRKFLVAFGPTVVVGALDDDKSRGKIHPHRQRGSCHQHTNTTGEQHHIGQCQRLLASVRGAALILSIWRERLALYMHLNLPAYR